MIHVKKKSKSSDFLILKLKLENLSLTIKKWHIYSIVTLQPTNILIANIFWKDQIHKNNVGPNNTI